jgi:outer membrane protein TolC
MTATLHRPVGPLLAAALACLAALPCPPRLRAGPTPPTDGPPVRRLTLEEARALALANNKSLELARLNVAEKEHAASAASRDYFPKVLGSVDWFHFDSALGNVVVTAPGRLGILAPGTALINTAVLNQNSTLSTVFAAQPITKLIAVNAAVKIARADENAAKAQLDKGTRDLLSGVTQAYEGMLGALRIQAALETQVKLLEQLLQLKPAPELRVGLVEARQGLLQVRGQIQELTATLNSLLDLPACTVLELVDPLPPELPVRCAGDAAQLALAHNPEVREAEQSVAKAEAALQVARMAYLPDVNVLGGWANQTAASYIEPNIGYFGMTGSYTFWDWGKRREMVRDRHALIAVARQNLAVVADKVQQDAWKAYNAFEQAREANRLAGEMVQARQEAEKAATGAALVQAKADTAKAELEAMKAEIAYRVAHAQLAALVCQE